MLPSFIDSSFTSRVEYEAWVKEQGPRGAVLVAWFGAGNTKEVTQRSLAPLLDAVREADIADTLPLYLAHEYPECPTWDAYVTRMIELIDQQFPARPLFLFGFSAGAQPAYAVAHRLGARVLKLVIAASRPTFNVSARAPGSGDESFGSISPEAFAQLPREEHLQGLVDAWAPNLRTFTNHKPERWPKGVADIVDQFVQLCSLPFYPGWAAIAHSLYGGRGPSISAPILVVSGEGEEPKGERPEKMEGWSELTTDSSKCELVTIAGMGHMNLLQRDRATKRCEAVDLIVARLTQASQHAAK